MRVQDIMTLSPITVRSDAALFEALDLMVTHHLSGLPVVDDCGILVGMLSEGDLLRRVELGTAPHPAGWFERLFRAISAETYRLLNGRKVSDVMSTPAITIEAAAPLADAAAIMEQHAIKRLAVMRDGDLVGILSRADFVRTLRTLLQPAYEEPATSDMEIRRTITEEINRQPWSTDCAVDVMVNNGRVILQGTVQDDSQRRAVGIAAENVNGVSSVSNELTMVEPVSIPFL